MTAKATAGCGLPLFYLFLFLSEIKLLELWRLNELLKKNLLRVIRVLILAQQ
jgi:hypothetical protein